MKNIRYVAQGEYHITTDPNTILFTCGMTECIAMEFVDKNNPNNRLLTHLDGAILFDETTSKENTELLVSEFKKITSTKEFDIHLLGGRQSAANIAIGNINQITNALKNLNLTITTLLTSKDFCDQYNKNKNRNSQIHMTDGTITLICDAISSPKATAFSSKEFEPQRSITEFESGEGLLNPEERKQYKKFDEANDIAQVSSTQLARKLRHCDDEKFIQMALSFKKNDKISTSHHTVLSSNARSLQSTIQGNPLSIKPTIK